MADIEHTDIDSAGCHEPKHFSNATTADAGKVLTPSSTTDGVSVLRKLTSADLAIASSDYMALSLSKTYSGDGGTHNDLIPDTTTEFSDGVYKDGNKIKAASGGVYIFFISNKEEVLVESGSDLAYLQVKSDSGTWQDMKGSSFISLFNLSGGEGIEVRDAHEGGVTQITPDLRIGIVRVT